MPWDKKVVDGKICVYKKTTGEVLHCYSGDDAEEQANKYMSALYMHSGEEAKDEYDLLFAPPEGESTIYVEKQGVDNSDFKKQLDSFSTFNALVRKEIRKGNI